MYTNKSSSLTNNKRRKRNFGSLKECNINRHKVTSKSEIVIPIPLMNSRVTKEDTLQ